MSSLVKNGGLSKDDVTKVVSKCLKDSDFVVSDFSCTAAGSQVTGFMAEHGKLIVTLEHRGESKELQFFLKYLPQQESQRNIVTGVGAFAAEEGFYNQIIPSLSSLGIQLAYPECYLARSGGVDDLLVLEDLSLSGHRLFDRHQPLDFDHCSLTLRELAKLHASSVVYEKKIGKPLDTVYPFLREMLFSEDAIPVMKKTCNTSIQTILQLAKFISRYENSLVEFEAKLSGLYAIAEDMVKPWNVLNVINHGDIWINNLLFKYNNYNKPMSVKLVDLQIARYGPPALDIIVFLNVSTNREIREKHESDLLKIYYESFMEIVHQLGTDLPAFTFERFLENYNSKRLLGAMYQVLYLPSILMDPSQAEKVVDPSANAFESYITDTQTAVACRLFKTNQAYRERLTETIDLLFEELLKV